MYSNNFVYKILKSVEGLCVLAFIITGFFTINFSVVFSPYAVSGLLGTLKSFVGLISFLGAISLIVARALYNGENWKPIALILVIWLALLIIIPIPLPTQAWLYICGLLITLLVTSALALVLITIGPIWVRVFSGVAFLGVIAFTGFMGFISGTAPFALEQSLKRDVLKTPYDVVEALDATSQSVAVEDGEGGFQPVQRSCSRNDVMCVVDVGNDIAKITEQLGMASADWQTDTAEENTALRDVDLYQMQRRQINIIIAQAYGRTALTVIDLSKLTEEQKTRTNFAIPPG